MFFRLVKCPQCGTLNFSPDMEKTIEHYISEYRNSLTLLIPSERPLKYIDSIVLTCSNETCNYTTIKTNDETLKLITDSWADTAWQIFQQENNNKVGFEKYFTRFIYEQGLDRFITSYDKYKNPWLQEIIKQVAKENEKHTKTR